LLLEDEDFEVVVIVIGGCGLIALEVTGNGTGNCVLKTVNTGALTVVVRATVDVTRVGAAVAVVKIGVATTIPDTADVVEFEIGIIEAVGSAIDGRNDIVKVLWFMFVKVDI